jgi:hypothetical protein
MQKPEEKNDVHLGHFSSPLIFEIESSYVAAERSVQGEGVRQRYSSGETEGRLPAFSASFSPVAPSSSSMSGDAQNCPNRSFRKLGPPSLVSATLPRENPENGAGWGREFHFPGLSHGLPSRTILM